MSKLKEAYDILDEFEADDLEASMTVSPLGHCFTLHQCELRRFALWFIHSHSGATGVFWPNCRVAYFRLRAKMTDASSKINVRRLKEGDLLIEIVVHCALLGLVFLVLGRS